PGSRDRQSEGSELESPGPPLDAASPESLPDVPDAALGRAVPGSDGYRSDAPEPPGAPLDGGSPAAAPGEPGCDAPPEDPPDWPPGVPEDVGEAPGPGGSGAGGYQLDDSVPGPPGAPPGSGGLC